jgi:hypothetical protein
MGGNQTTVTVVVFAAAFAKLLSWPLGFFFPEFMAAAPDGAEGAAEVVITAAICFYWPQKAA